jgi:hypothetical protein
MGKVASGAFSFLFSTVGALTLVACGDCHDDDAAADAFLAAPENRVCQTADDCVVVSTGCAKLKQSFCGQALLSAEAAASPRWRELHGAASDCAEGECAICGAAILRSCEGGFCGGR